jgi:hypothetical protein
MTLTIQQDAARADRTVPDYWQWRVWIEGTEEELDQVESVRYQLHQTFPEPTRIINDRASKFALSSMGWGEFTIYAALKFKDKERKEQFLNHWLRLGGSPKEPTWLGTLNEVAPSVFLSSSFADFHLANGIAEALRARQVHVIDPNDPKRSGVSFADSVASKLGDADLAVMIVGERTGEWVDWETKKLLAGDKDIIPVVFAEKVPDRLAKFNAIRIKPGESADAIADRIVAVMPGFKGGAFGA